MTPPAGQTGVPPSPPATRRDQWLERWVPRRRAALGLTHHAAPAAVYVAVGVVLGPATMGVVTPTLLAQLDPLVSLALAVLGVFIGAGVVGAPDRDRLRVLLGATAESGLALATVFVALLLLLSYWGPALPVAPATAALVLAIGAATSAAPQPSAPTPETRVAVHLADLDDLPVVILASVLVPLLGTDDSALAVAMTVVAGGVIALVGALLFVRAANPPERLVFVLGTVLLLGGAAAYAGGSPLTAGCVAGVIWASRADTAAVLSADLHKVQRPLVVVLLIIAGASVQVGYPLVWIAAPIVLFRLTGKLAGGMVAARVVGLEVGLVATVLAPPGVTGIAIALNIQQVLATGDTVLLSALTVAAATSELVATALLPPEEAT